MCRYTRTLWFCDGRDGDVALLPGESKLKVTAQHTKRKTEDGKTSKKVSKLCWHSLAIGLKALRLYTPFTGLLL